jgi:hypothetical protein
VHGGYEHQAFGDATLLDDQGDLVCDSDELLALLGLEPEVFGVSSYGL